jgi:hypothetical protein
VIENGQEFRLAKFGISRTGFSYDGETIPWDVLGYLRFDKEELVAPKMGNRTFAYDTLALADRWLLQMLELAAHYGGEDANEDEDDDEDEDEERGLGEDGRS